MKNAHLRSTTTSIALISLIASGAAHAATYYVDQTAGNDGASGTSPGAAWKNAPGMSGYTGSGQLTAGDTVQFDSADTWLVSGTQGIYLVGGVTYLGTGWGSGTRATLRANTDIESAVVRFRDHATLPTVFSGFNVDANGKVTNGIEMNHSFYAGPLTGATKRIDNVDVHHTWSRASQGQYRYGIIVSNHGGSSGEVANVEILNSLVHDTSRDALAIYPGDENANCIVRNVVVRGNRVYNTGQDPDYGAGAAIIAKGRVIDTTIERNYIGQTKGAGIFVNGNESNHFGFGPKNLHIRFNIVATSSGHGSIRLYDGQSGKDPKEANIYGNIVYGNPSGAGFFIDTDLGASNTLRIYNNTFIDAPVVINNSAATFPVFEFRNNLLVASSGTPLTENGRFTSHSNNFFSGASTLVRSGGTSYSSATLTSYEPTARSGDPLFMDRSSLPTAFVTGVNGAPTTGGLALRSGSAAIDGGAALSSAFAGSVNGVTRPAGAGWDIGAYEAAGAARPLPPSNLTVSP